MTTHAMAAHVHGAGSQYRVTPVIRSALIQAMTLYAMVIKMDTIQHPQSLVTRNTCTGTYRYSSG